MQVFGAIAQPASDAWTLGIWVWHWLAGEAPLLLDGPGDDGASAAELASRLLVRQLERQMSGQDHVCLAWVPPASRWLREAAAAVPELARGMDAVLALLALSTNARGTLAHASAALRCAAAKLRKARPNMVVPALGSPGTPAQQRAEQRRLNGLTSISKPSRTGADGQVRTLHGAAVSCGVDKAALQLVQYEARHVAHIIVRATTAQVCFSGLQRARR